jgi:hypothetical protein
MELKIDVSTLSVIPLRYYNGWTIAFNVRTETFQSDLLCLYGFSNVKDLEIAMDQAIKRRAQ